MIVLTKSMLEGPMDFTPGLLSLKGSDNSDKPLTIANQLALYAAIHSPVQMVADTRDSYGRDPEALKIVRDVPVDWEDALVLKGEVGDLITFARRDRKSRDWCLGSISDEDPRTLTVPLDFLDANLAYTAGICRDGRVQITKPRSAARSRLRRSVCAKATSSPSHSRRGQTIRFRSR
jgi:alpha-glucosidase